MPIIINDLSEKFLITRMFVKSWLSILIPIIGKYRVSCGWFQLSGPSSSPNSGWRFLKFTHSSSVFLICFFRFDFQYSRYIRGACVYFNDVWVAHTVENFAFLKSPFQLFKWNFTTTIIVFIIAASFSNFVYFSSWCNGYIKNSLG